MEMMDELVLSPKSHHTDDVKLQNVKIFRDYAGQLRPGMCDIQRARVRTHLEN